MQEPQILHNTEDYDFFVWHTSRDPVFSEISKKSRLPEKWIEASYISKEYKNSIIKPINRYVEQIYVKPELISIENNVVRLRQRNSAQFFLLQKPNEFYNIDRLWMRQYYKSSIKETPPDDCWPDSFKFFVPWYIDADVIVCYESPDEESPFFIYEGFSKHSPVQEDAKYIEPDFVRFCFKKRGKHMVTQEKFGKILLKQPMFDMLFQCDDIMIERVKEFFNA
jgi:hypothetical protein